MKIGAPKERAQGEARVALTPESAQHIQKLGHTCVIESGAGLAAGFDDAAYRDAGVEIVEGADALWSTAEVVIKEGDGNGMTLVQYLDKTKNNATDNN